LRKTSRKTNSGIAAQRKEVPLYLHSTVVKVALLCVTLCQWATAAELKIVGPELIPVGGTAFLKLEGAKRGDPFDFFVTPTSRTLVVLFDAEDTPIGVFNGDKSGPVTAIGVRYDAESKKVTRSLHTLTVGPAKPVDPVDPVEPVDPTVPPVVTPPVTTPSTATAATFIYEKDQHVVPKEVLSALNKLNREKKIVATILEADTTDGTGQVPEQYKVALAAAKQKGLPCLVVTAGDKVLAIVPNPKNEAEVLKAVP
jgi:hypothetical protein